jgi:phospholipase C
MVIEFLRSRIHHVIYIIKENRTYDQVLGDLEVGNGDPDLTLFPDLTAPNHHALVRQFVTLDSFFLRLNMTAGPLFTPVGSSLLVRGSVGYVF